MAEKVSTKQMKPVGSGLSMTLDNTTFVLTIQLKDQSGNNLGASQSVDLPLETMVVSGSYDDATKKIILTLQNGQTIEVPVGDLISGLQTEITNDNKLPASLISGLDLDALDDVVIESLSGGQVLMYNATLQKWVNSTSTATVNFDGIGGDPYDNTALKDALDDKASVDLSDITSDGENVIKDLAASGGYDDSETYDSGTIGEALQSKADAATTLAGYNISDAYTKSEVDTAIGQKISCVLRRW